jgi:hypothetical protein
VRCADTQSGHRACRWTRPCFATSRGARIQPSSPSRPVPGCPAIRAGPWRGVHGAVEAKRELARAQSGEPVFALIWRRGAELFVQMAEGLSTSGGCATSCADTTACAARTRAALLSELAGRLPLSPSQPLGLNKPPFASRRNRKTIFDLRHTGGRPGGTLGLLPLGP